MEPKIELKKEYVIRLTQEEAEVLCDLLEYVPDRKGKKPKEDQKRTEIKNLLFEYIENMLESEE